MDVSKETRQEAVMLAKDTAKIFEVSLDYSNESIKKVEDLLDKASLKFSQDSNENEARKTAFAFASYLVEVVEKNFPEKKGLWKVDDENVGENTYPYILAEGGTFFPFAWCMKRIIDGKGDDVWFKYQNLILNNGVK